MISERRDHDEGGLLYAGRRKFLVSSGKNSLEPPTRFLTRGQAHKKAVFEKINERDSGTQPKFKFDILTQVKSKESKRDKKNLNAHADDTIVIEKFSSTSRRDWREQTRAGVKIWTNKNTGEVSTECPYNASSKHKSSQNENENNDFLNAGSSICIDPSEEFGTGCLVYDDSEINDLFAMLDNEKAKSSSSSQKQQKFPSEVPSSIQSNNLAPTI